MDITYYVACSLDGFIADPGGGLGWLRPFEGTGDDYGYADFYASTDSVLLGRGTFDFLAGLDWPYAGKPTWVFTHRPLEQLPPDTIATPDSPSVVTGILRSRGLRHAYLVGGGQLARSFRSAGLITHYSVSIAPVILGRGLPMIAPGGRANSLAFVGSKTFDSGIVQVEYRSGRDAQPEHPTVSPGSVR